MDYLFEWSLKEPQNLEIYAGEGKKLQETIFTLLEPYLDQNYHVYQGNYYNHVTTAETLLSRQVRVCSFQDKLEYVEQSV